MFFTITRVSSSWDEEAPIRTAEKKDVDRLDWEGKPWKSEEWVIEYNDLDSLLGLVEEEGDIIIRKENYGATYQGNMIGSIAIYDDFTE